MNENEPLQMIRRVSFYGCDTFHKRVALQEFLEKAGAIFQDYKFLHSEPKIIIWYSLRVEPSLFKARILESVYADGVEFITPI
jgi:hypothetical protein